MSEDSGDSSSDDEGAAGLKRKLAAEAAAATAAAAAGAGAGSKKKKQKTKSTKAQADSGDETPGIGVVKWTTKTESLEVTLVDSLFPLNLELTQPEAKKWVQETLAKFGTGTSVRTKSLQLTGLDVASDVSILHDAARLFNLDEEAVERSYPVYYELHSDKGVKSPAQRTTFLTSKDEDEDRTFKEMYLELDEVIWVLDNSVTRKQLKKITSTHLMIFLRGYETQAAFLARSGGSKAGAGAAHGAVKRGPGRPAKAVAVPAPSTSSAMFNFYFNPPKYLFKNSNDEEVSVFAVPSKTPKAVDDQIPKASILADFPLQEDEEGEFSRDALLLLANQAFTAIKAKENFKMRWGSAKTSINGFFIVEAQQDLSELPDECRSASTEEELFIIFPVDDSCTDINSFAIPRTFYFHNGTTINLAVCSVAAKNMLDAKKPSFSNMGSALLKTSMLVSAKQSLFNILNQKKGTARPGWAESLSDQQQHMCAEAIFIAHEPEIKKLDTAKHMASSALQKLNDMSAADRAKLWAEKENPVSPVVKKATGAGAGPGLVDPTTPLDCGDWTRHWSLSKRRHYWINKADTSLHSWTDPTAPQQLTPPTPP